MIVGLLATTFAFAQDRPLLAIIPLDASPGTDPAGLERTVRGVAAAVQAEGGVVAVYDTELAERLAAEGELASARSSLADGRRFVAEGDPDIAIPFLQQAVEAHTAAGSDVVRRGEAADAHYALARAYLATYDDDRARAELRRAIVLFPDYMATRADALDPRLEGLAAEVTQALSERPPRRLAPDGAALLARELGADCIAHGAVSGDGALAVTVQHGAEVRFVVNRPGPFAAPAVGDRWYGDIAGQIVAACLGEPVPTWRPPVVAIGPDPITPVEPTRAEPTRSRAAKRTAVAASMLTVGVLGLAGGGAAYYLLPGAGGPTATWTVVVTLP